MAAFCGLAIVLPLVRMNLFCCLFGRIIWKGDEVILRYLTLKTPNENCSRRHFNCLVLSFEENKA